MKIQIRKRPISKGRRFSLFLDFSPPVKHPVDGKAIRFHSLSLYLHARPANADQRKENKKTMELAEKLRSRIYMMLADNDLSFLGHHSGSALIFDYMYELAEKRSKNTKGVWRNAINALKRFGLENSPIASIDAGTLERYRKHLLENYSHNTAFNYFSHLKCALRTAHRKGIIKENPAFMVENITMKSTVREFLLPHEVEALAHTPCRKPVIKTAFLFSAMTGLRISDIEFLTRDNIVMTDDGPSLRFQQRKTGKIQYHPISTSAYNLLISLESRNGLLFPQLRYYIYNQRSKNENPYFDEWLKNAGIKRRITFHAARHTYAVLQLESGTRIEVLRDLMGHSKLSTTMVYTHIVDSARRVAADRIQLPVIAD